MVGLKAQILQDVSNLESDRIVNLLKMAFFVALQ